MTAWVIRAGRDGENEQWCLEHGYAGVGWNEFKDISAVSSKEAMRARVDSARPEATSGARAQWTTQLWALRAIEPGDLVVMPMKTTQTIAIGVCAQPYHYLADESDLTRRHVIGVDWKRDDVARSAIRQDLLYTLGALATVFRAKRNGAEERFRAVLETSVDPKLDEPWSPTRTGPGDEVVTDDEDESGVFTDPVTVPTLSAIRDRVLAHVTETFREHELTNLIAAILRVRGFRCEVSPPGPDGGVDILAGSGPLGLDSPTLICEVKSSPTAQGVDVVRKLQGAMLSNRSDQGLLVAWGGITKEARRSIASDRLTMRVWDADEVLDQLFEVYEELPPEMRVKIPMKRAWVLDEEAG